MRNILILTQELYPDRIGGSAKVAWQQAKSLASLKYNVSIVTGSDVEETKFVNNIQIISYINTNSKSLSDLKQGKQIIAKQIANNNYDLVIIHHPYIGKAFLNLKKNIPYIYMFHASTALETKWQGMDIESRHKLLGRIFKPYFVYYTKRIENKLLIKAKQIWSLSNFSDNIIKKLYPRIGSKIQRVPYILELNKFLPAEDKNKLREEFNVNSKDVIAITVRRLVPRMGLEWLIKSIPAIIKKHKTFKLLIIGNGYLKENLNILIKKNNLGGKVILLGRLPETTLIKYLQLADIFILPTLAYEGFGLATVESLAASLPVIGTNIGATPEIINAFNKNLLLQNIDSPALLNCIDYCLINKKNLAVSARQFSENNYGDDNNKIFAKLLDKVF
ncbi:MAG: glycosyltransferase family 4 protein [Candidatus Komeilibacteria bacterium]